MLRRFTSFFLIASITLAPLYAAELPIRRIMLYKHGVGYFERSGSTAGADIVLEFKASEMNDVLKSLTLLDRSGGRVSGVSYESSDPIEKQLANFGFTLPPDAGLAEVLAEFKGARVVVHTQSTPEMAGSILGARRVALDKTEEQLLTLLLDNGEIRSVPLTEATSLRLEDPRRQRDLASYLSIVAGSLHHDLRTLHIHPGTARELTVGYVVEAPVWKSSYRLAFHTAKEKEGAALLQGWAIVDNPSNEDWKDVELSLVSGLPISFTQNLYDPHYMRRPNVPLPYEMAVAPQVFEGAITDAKKSPVFTPPPPAPAAMPRGVAGGQAGGVIGGVVATGGLGGGGGRVVAAERFKSENKERLMDTDLLSANAALVMGDSIETAAQGMELGDLFEYRVDKRLDIPKHESAMIPFLQEDVKAERVLLFDASSGRQNPFDAVLLTNTSKLTLDGGSITVLDGDRYLGESLIENLKPGDNRPVTFAVDLGTRLTTAFDSHNDQITSVKVHRGIITTMQKNVEVKTYTIRNTGDKARPLIVQHPVRSGWKLSAGTAKPEETTAQHYRFRVPLPAKDTVKMAVGEEMEYPVTTQVNNLNSDLIAVYVRNKAIGPEAQKKLEGIVALKDRLAETQKKINARQEEINELRTDQNRLGQNIQNLRNLPGQTAQVDRYAAKLGDQEKTMENLQAQLTAERNNLRQTQQELDRAIAELEI
jgi:hypothetical protein